MAPAKYAILIAIDFYFNRSGADKSNHRDLRGCINDIKKSEAYLRQHHGMSDAHIKILQSSGQHADTEAIPIEPKHMWPTKANIVAAFNDTTERAQHEDWLFVHFAGHGTRKDSIYASLKGFKDGTGKDEALVAVDEALGNNALLRDVEIAVLLLKMIQKGLNVTILLDCCYSGGATRRNDDEQNSVVAFRGIDEHDLFPRSHCQEQFVIDFASKSMLGELFHSKLRDTATGPHWLKNGKGYTVFAACKSQEKSMEKYFHFDGKYYGLLTYHLFEILVGLSGSDLSQQRLHEILCAQFSELGYSNTSQTDPQTPVFIDGRRSSFFGPSKDVPATTAYVTKVISDSLIELNVGKMHGIDTDTEYAIYALEGEGDTHAPPLIGTATVKQMNNSFWEAQFSSDSPPEAQAKVQVGCQAKILKHVPPMIIYVQLKLQDKSISDAWHDLEANWATLTSRGIALALLADTDPFPAKGTVLSVTIEEDKYTIAENNVPLIIPPFPLPCETTEKGTLVIALQHLALFSVVRELKNVYPLSKLDQHFTLEVEHIKSGLSSHNASIQEDDEFNVVFRNHHSCILHLTIFDLAPRYAITQIWPEDSAYVSVDIEQKEVIPLQAVFPDALKVRGLKEIADTLLAVVTEEPISFSALRMLQLNQSLKNYKDFGLRSDQASVTIFETLLDHLQPRREVRVRSRSIREWQTAKVNLRIQVKT